MEYKLSKDQEAILPKYIKEMTYRTIAPFRPTETHDGAEIVPIIIEHNIDYITINSAGTFITTKD